MHRLGHRRSNTGKMREVKGPLPRLKQREMDGIYIQSTLAELSPETDLYLKHTYNGN
jgi:hypothetical protein